MTSAQTSQRLEHMVTLPATAAGAVPTMMVNIWGDIDTERVIRDSQFNGWRLSFGGGWDLTYNEIRLGNLGQPFSTFYFQVKKQRMLVESPAGLGNSVLQLGSLTTGSFMGKPFSHQFRTRTGPSVIWHGELEEQTNGLTHYVGMSTPANVSRGNSAILLGALVPGSVYADLTANRSEWLRELGLRDLAKQALPPAIFSYLDGPNVRSVGYSGPQPFFGSPRMVVRVEGQ